MTWSSQFCSECVVKWRGARRWLQDAELLLPGPCGVVSPTVAQKVKNSPDLAWEFMNLMFSPEPQSCWVAAIQYPVVDTKATYNPHQKARMPEWQSVRWSPFAETLVNMPRWVETWNKDIGR
jgi:putative spermidine/putrescine transport system substrate-binding protein